MAPLIIGTAEGSVIISFTMSWFNVPLRGDLFLLYAGLILPKQHRKPSLGPATGRTYHYNLLKVITYTDRHGMTEKS